VTAVLAATGLGKQYGRRQPLVPAGRPGVRRPAGVRRVLTYQPTSHYWPTQWYELAIFAGLALILAGFCFWWLRRQFA
jgi:hypothetical protein